MIQFDQDIDGGLSALILGNINDNEQAMQQSIEDDFEEYEEFEDYEDEDHMKGLDCVKIMDGLFIGDQGCASVSSFSYMIFTQILTILI